MNTAPVMPEFGFPVADSATEQRDSNGKAPHLGLIATLSGCAIESGDQIPMLQHSLASMSGSNFTCPLCFRVFHLKKTLVRHANAAIGAFYGSPFLCRAPRCGRRFARKDTLTRHERFQHNGGTACVTCTICGQQVRPRSLKGHQRTQSCVNGGQRGDGALAIEVERGQRHPDDSWEAFASLHSHLRDVLDCVYLAAWMFTKLKPWGPNQESISLWLGQNQPPPLYEVEKLKCLFLGTTRQAVAAPDMPSNGHLLDAIAAIKVVTMMTEGWEFSHPHSDAYKKLAHIQIQRMGLTKNDFVESAPSQTWDSVLTQIVAEKDRRECKSIITQLLRLMRVATWDSVSCLTGNFTKPLDDHAIKRHTRWNTRQMFFEGYGDEVGAIYATASSIGQEQRPVAAPC